MITSNMLHPIIDFETCSQYLMYIIRVVYNRKLIYLVNFKCKKELPMGATLIKLLKNVNYLPVFFNSFDKSLSIALISFSL